MPLKKRDKPRERKKPEEIKVRKASEVVDPMALKLQAQKAIETGFPKKAAPKGITDSLVQPFSKFMDAFEKEYGEGVDLMKSAVSTEKSETLLGAVGKEVSLPLGALQTVLSPISAGLKTFLTDPVIDLTTQYREALIELEKKWPGAGGAVGGPFGDLMMSSPHAPKIFGETLEGLVWFTSPTKIINAIKLGNLKGAEAAAMKAWSMLANQKGEVSIGSSLFTEEGRLEAMSPLFKRLGDIPIPKGFQNFLGTRDLRGYIQILETIWIGVTEGF